MTTDQAKLRRIHLRLDNSELDLPVELSQGRAVLRVRDVPYVGFVDRFDCQ